MFVAGTFASKLILMMSAKPLCCWQFSLPQEYVAEAFLHRPIVALPHPHKGKHDLHTLDKHSDVKQVTKLTLLLPRIAGECDGSLDTQPYRCSVPCGHQSPEPRRALGNLL